MNIDLEKFERFQERFYAVCDAVKRGEENVVELGRAVSFKRSIISRTARMPSIFVPKPDRFRNIDGREAACLEYSYNTEPRQTLAELEASTPDHPLVALMRDHLSAVDALSKAERRLAEHRAEVARMNPTITRCREFIRSLNA